MSEVQSVPTDKELFDRAIKALIAQGGPGIGLASGQCMYRTQDGRHCGVGVLLTQWPLEIESLSIHIIVPDGGRWTERENSGKGDALIRVLTTSGIPARRSTYAMLCRLQDFHDGTLRSWKTGPWKEFIERAVRVLGVFLFDDHGMFTRDEP